VSVFFEEEQAKKASAAANSNSILGLNCSVFFIILYKIIYLL